MAIPSAPALPDAAPPTAAYDADVNISSASGQDEAPPAYAESELAAPPNIYEDVEGGEGLGPGYWN